MLLKIKLCKTSIQWLHKLHKAIIKKFEKQKYTYLLKIIFWVADLSDMHLIITFKKGNCFLLYVIDIYCKYVWVVSLKDTKGVTITDVFQNILDESGRKPYKIWVYKDS